MGLAFVPSTGYVVGIFLIGKTVRVNTVHFTDRSKKYVTSTVTLVMPSPQHVHQCLGFLGNCCNEYTVGPVTFKEYNCEVQQLLNV
jgi:hypothetical protein